MYLFDTKSNSNTIELRVTWQLLGEIVGEIVNRLGASAGLVDDALSGGRQ